MGYELHIKRLDKNHKISKEEWCEYINSNSDFEPMQEFSAELNEGENFTISTPNTGLWKCDKGEIPFTFSEKYGEITVKNPEEWIIEKMILIASELNAVVEGEEGEIYNEDYLHEIFSSDKEKKWWQFWK